jgi:hypothetical protein
MITLTCTCGEVLHVTSYSVDLNGEDTQTNDTTCSSCGLNWTIKTYSVSS